MIKDKKTFIIVFIIMVVLGIGAAGYMISDKDAAEVGHLCQRALLNNPALS